MTVAEQTIQSKPAHIFIPYAILATVLFAFFITYVNKVPLKAGETEYPEKDFIAPGFELPTLAGGKINLQDYRGKVVFINFWATWCATCKEEMPSMQKVYDRFKDQGLEMLTISVDKDQSLIQPFMDKYQLTFPVLLDPDSEVAKKDYKTTGVPETFIVDKRGIIVFKAIGPRDWATNEAMEAFALYVQEPL